MNDSNDAPAATWAPLKFPAGVAEQDWQDASARRQLPSHLGWLAEGTALKDTWGGPHLLLTNATYAEDVQVGCEQGKKSSALFYPYTTVCYHASFTAQEDED